MRITQKKLAQVIKEEATKIINEQKGLSTGGATGRREVFAADLTAPWVHGGKMRLAVGQGWPSKQLYFAQILRYDPGTGSIGGGPTWRLWALGTDTAPGPAVAIAVENYVTDKWRLAKDDFPDGVDGYESGRDALRAALKKALKAVGTTEKLGYPSYP